MLQIHAAAPIRRRPPTLRSPVTRDNSHLCVRAELSRVVARCAFAVTRWLSPSSRGLKR